MSETLLTLIIFFIFLAIAITLFIVIKRFEKRRLDNRKKIKLDAKPKLKLNLPFLSNNEVKFLSIFQLRIPDSANCRG